MSTDLNVNFLGIRMKTPIIAASGTFGFGVEYKDYMDLSQIGAISCKGIAITPWDSNERRSYRRNVIRNTELHWPRKSRY